MPVRVLAGLVAARRQDTRPLAAWCALDVSSAHLGPWASLAGHDALDTMAWALPGLALVVGAALHFGETKTLWAPAALWLVLAFALRQGAPPPLSLLVVLGVGAVVGMTLAVRSMARTGSVDRLGAALLVLLALDGSSALAGLVAGAAHVWPHVQILNAVAYGGLCLLLASPAPSRLRLLFT